MKTWFDSETVIAPLDAFAKLPDWLAAGMDGDACQGVTPAAGARIHRRAASPAVVYAGTPASQGGRMARPLSAERR